MRITTKGQVTIPQHIRKALGLMANTEVDFILEGSTVRLVKAKGSMSRGKAAVTNLKATADVKMTTDQIMALTRGRRR